MMTLRRWIGCLALLACGGCGDTERPRHVTKYLEVELFDDEVICAGTLAAMDEQVKRVTSFLQVDVPERISVHYGPSVVEENCAGRGGCARASGVYATSGSIFHELVHAVRQSQGNGGSVGTWLFEEGFAEVMAGYRWQVQHVLAQASTTERGPAVLAAFPRGQGKFLPGDYALAAHFVSWLRTNYGDTVLEAYLNDARYLGGEAYAEAFVAHFAMTIDEADAAWRMATSTKYVWSDVCDPAYDLSWVGGTLEFSDSADCEAPHTTGPSGYLGAATLRSHCFSLGQAKTLRVEFISNGGWLRLIPVDCVDDGALEPEYYEYKSLKGGEADDLPFAACAWEVQVDGIAGLPQDFTLRLTQL
ncbi:hypothetical protein [Nannocystis radixulma]|uniref:Lipoprotein n=1 Tax=Nannocystis radixulma TaxID=2995305 RepID=A0ABT5B6V1_9BACT|nr:hypothetical protein [Nannocystis radixulma]MDC0669836.1 hypothetical protein [Nannocystis radixulma]